MRTTTNETLRVKRGAKIVAGEAVTVTRTVLNEYVRVTAADGRSVVTSNLYAAGVTAADLPGMPVTATPVVKEWK
jgi:hypothetical protein